MLYLSEEEEELFDGFESCQYRVLDILDHRCETPMASQQGSTIEKSREVLMSDIEKTIEQLVTSVLVGEPIKLPLVVRKLTTSTQQK